MLILSSNPCFDATFWVKDLVPGSVVRSMKNTYLPGSKGINVARVGKTMGAKNVRLAVMLPKLEGEVFKELLALENHNVSYLDIDGEIRKAILINKENSLDSTVIVGKGSEIKARDWERFCEFVKSLVKPGELVTIMGSLPNNSPTDGLEQISKIIQQGGGVVLVDSSPASLKSHGNVILDFISPNLDEAEALINNTPDNVYLVDEINIQERAMAAADKLQGKIAKTVLITSGKFGVALKTESEHVWIPAYTLPDEKFKSSVGAGDSFVAGFAMYLEENPNQLQKAIQFGMACAAAQCETFEPGNLIKNRALEIFETGRA
ncbi:MAG: hypothetical protein RL129_478 [Actinomycetota bacterium]